MQTKTIVNEEVFPFPVEMALTEKEIIAYTDELTTLDSKTKEIQMRHAAEKSKYKQEIESASSYEERLMHLLKTKKEVKQIDCYNEFDYFEGIVSIKRVDNEETVKTRKITAEEYQQNLPLQKDLQDEED